MANFTLYRDATSPASSRPTNSRSRAVSKSFDNVSLGVYISQSPIFALARGAFNGALR